MDPTGRAVNAAGIFFRYESAGGEGMDPGLRVRADGNDLGVYLPGDAIELPGVAKQWEFQPASCSAVIKVGMGKISTVRSTLVGSLSISNQVPNQVAMTSSRKTVTTGGGVVIAAAAGRRYALLQNRDATVPIALCFGAPGAFVDGLLIGPGSFWEWDSSTPNNAVYAYASGASNTNIIVVEG